MANIVLTYKCNLNCSYCFANEFVNKKNIDISFENFLKAYEFIRRSKNERIGLIGGEPTLHPEFQKILEFLVSEKKKYKFNNPIMIFTNGIEISNYIDLINKGKIGILVNCNSPENINMKNYEKLKTSLSILHKKAKNSFNIGINLYSKDMDYDYIFDLLKLYKQKYLRLSLTVPNLDADCPEDVEKYFKDNKNFIFNVLKRCYENDILPFYDCNIFRKCLLVEDDLMLLNKFKTKFNLLNYPDCIPIIDILPDLTAVRCFGLSNFLKVPISDFDSPYQLKKFFVGEIDNYAGLLPASKSCVDCMQKKTLQCSGGCLAYKLPNIIKLKKHCKDYVECTNPIN